MIVTWQELNCRLVDLGIDSEKETVYGVPKGGMIAAGFLQKAKKTWDPKLATVILDDIEDSGWTRYHYSIQFPSTRFVTLVDKREEGIREWVVLPWETDHPTRSSIEPHIIRQLQYIGEDPTRPGLRDTPHRVMKAWEELYGGYKVDVPSLFKVFDEGIDEMVVLQDIRLVSTCEHHLLPFMGKAAVGYLPQQGRVLGLSKLARVVNAFARRLQLQERLTKEIAEAVQNYLRPRGVGVIIRAHHTCMGIRGVSDGGTEMVTSCMLGDFRTEPTVRGEFLSLVRK